MQSLIPDIKVLEAGSAPLVSAMCDEIHLTEVLNQLIPWDEKQCRLSPGLRIKALVVNVLSHRRPLYKVIQAFQDYDLEILFGAGVTPDAFNDDALGRALDKLGGTSPESIYLTLALTAMKVHGITINSMHGDTASVSVYGDYDREDCNDILNITCGYNKAHRPDLKQFLYGLVTNQEGIPFFGQVKDGNLDDKSWNKELLTKMTELLPDLGSPKPLYVADSALVTQENLKLMGDQIPFISRLPNTYKLAEVLKDEAFAVQQWQNIGTAVLATADGVVTTAAYDAGGYGNYLIIDHGNGNLTLYAHLSQMSAGVGQTVKQGPTIGFLGSTGLSTGPHLHFEVYVGGTRVDPLLYFSNYTAAC